MLKYQEADLEKKIERMVSSVTDHDMLKGVVERSDRVEIFDRVIIELAKMNAKLKNDIAPKDVKPPPAVCQTPEFTENEKSVLGVVFNEIRRLMSTNFPKLGGQITFGVDFGGRKYGGVGTQVAVVEIPYSLLPDPPPGFEKMTCVICTGTGNDPKKRDGCERCGSSGWVWAKKADPEDLLPNVPCKRCNGTGQISGMVRGERRSAPCSDCESRGYTTPTVPALAGVTFDPAKLQAVEERKKKTKEVALDVLREIRTRFDGLGVTEISLEIKSVDSLDPSEMVVFKLPGVGDPS